MNYVPFAPTPEQIKNDWLRLEYVTTCVGFDDLLDLTLARNIGQFDTVIVVTSHEDHKTQSCVRKHGATLVLSDLFKKDGRTFNKGAAINDGFNYFRFYGWRCFLDSDILLPAGFRQRLYNHEELVQYCLYGVDRMDVNGKEAIQKLLESHGFERQHMHGCLLGATAGELSHRYTQQLSGPGVLGYFAMWNASCQKPYPYSLGTAQHDDIAWSNLWPRGQRRHITSSLVYHLHPGNYTPIIGQNWDGNRRMPRL
jgi:glycosyltransferase involved in cell wall biosynthesis